MKHVFLFVSFFLMYSSLQAQTLEGVFSCQGKEEAIASASQLTAIAGQPCEGTTAGTPLSYGFIETVSTANEYTNVRSLDLEKALVSTNPGEQLPLTAIFSPEKVDNPTVSWFSSDPTVATVKDGVVSALKEGNTTVTVISACGMYADNCELTVSANPTSIEEVNSGNRIYPTVTKDYLYADLQQAQTVYIINIAGKICGKVPCQAGQNTLSMQAYPSGIYFIRVDKEVVKVVKQ